uniref:Uncharacterized protein n=1 Tax=Anguilla anguilla TaxID=7936 RepID=A0A0E9VXB4_ANGAN
MSLHVCTQMRCCCHRLFKL